MTIINHPIKPEKGKAWHWISHQYFTKQASNVVAEYIEHYTQTGDTVADPFCGTGVTAIEALRLGRKAVVSDINPLASFITEQNCRKISIEAALAEFDALESLVKPEIVQYYAISDSEIERLDISCWYPNNIRLPKNSDFEFVHDLFSRRQLISHSFLFHIINQIKDIDLRNFFRFVFSANISKVNLTYMPSEKNGKQIGGGGAAIFGTYRYWKPPVFRELDVWSNFEYRFKKILKGKQIWNDLTKDIDIDSNLKVINASVLDLTKYIPENSVDYIYTDPPYGGNIAYLDLSTMWNAWLGFDVDDSLKKEEIIEGGDLDKTQKDYESLLSQSFEQMSRVLKKDKWLSLVFAHKKLEFWNLIIDANEDNGLEFKGSVYQPTNNSSVHFKKNPANVLCSQRIANFQKTFERSARKKYNDIKDFILSETEKAYIEKGILPADAVYQNFLERMLK